MDDLIKMYRANGYSEDEINSEMEAYQNDIGNQEQLNATSQQAFKEDNLIIGEGGLLNNIGGAIKDTYNASLNFQTGGKLEEANYLEKFAAGGLGLIGGIPAGVVGGGLELLDDVTGEVVGGAAMSYVQDSPEIQKGISALGEFNERTRGAAGVALDIIGAGTGVGAVGKFGWLKGTVSEMGIPTKVPKFESIRGIFSSKAKEGQILTKDELVKQSNERDFRGALDNRTKEAAAVSPTDFNNEIIDSIQNYDKSFFDKKENPLNIGYRHVKEKVLEPFERWVKKEGKMIGEANDKIKSTKINPEVMETLEGFNQNFVDDLATKGIVKNADGFFQVKANSTSRFSEEVGTLNKINSIIKTIKGSDKLDNLMEGIKELDNNIINWSKGGTKKFSNEIENLAKGLRAELVGVRDKHLTSPEAKAYVNYSEAKDFMNEFKMLSKEKGMKLLLRRGSSLLSDDLGPISNFIKDKVPEAADLSAMAETFANSLKYATSDGVKTMFSQKIGDEIMNSLMSGGHSTSAGALGIVKDVITAKRNALADLKKWGSVEIIKKADDIKTAAKKPKVPKEIIKASKEIEELKTQIEKKKNILKTVSDTRMVDKFTAEIKVLYDKMKEIIEKIIEWDKKQGQGGYIKIGKLTNKDDVKN